MLTRINKNNTQELAAFIAGRNQEISSDVLIQVSKIIEDVKENKDEACRRYTKQFDGVDQKTFRVTEKELDEAIQQCDPDFCKAMQKAAQNITDFHQAQRQKGYRLQKEMGIYLGQRVLTIVTGKTTHLMGACSSVLMNAIPAHVAGVKRIVMVTPPDKQGKIHPNIAYAAKIAGVSEIYKIGGAQAIAALAYGTQSIQSVDKITGPGNIYVAAAKKMVFGKVDIDMIAGPSEILVVADEEADPEYVAADLISQAEHDPMASAILVTTSQVLLEKVNAALQRQSAVLPKKDIIEASLRDYGKSVICDTIEECIAISNAVAPEHLELMVKEPEMYLDLVKNAGSVFMGYYTCESIGDYFGGTNHVLPTSGTARFSSALGVDAFIKKSSYLHYTQEAIEAYGKEIIVMAKEEQLQGHANAARIRMEDKQ